MRAVPGMREALALLLILLLAAALRLCCLKELPPGLHFDEGFKGVTARAIVEGAEPQLFFEEDMGEEPIAIYLVALALRLLGQEPWVIRLASALVGLLTVPLAWYLGRELFRNRLAGLATALVLAILYWHVSFSRIGMEPILVPFFATLAFAALTRALNTGRLPAFALAGLALGSSLYTYKAGYFVPILALLYVGCAALVDRSFLRRHGRGLALAALLALLVATPLAVYFLTHLEHFLHRPASVTSPAGELAGNLLRVLGMFFVQGDANPRSNLPGRPVLDPFLALLFLVGLGRLLVQASRGHKGGRTRALLPLLWLVVMVVPTLVTEHAPHFGRAIGATPAVALLCAAGIDYVLRGLSRRRGEHGEVKTMSSVSPRFRPRLTIWLAALLALGLAYSTAATARAYFHTWGTSPELFYAYDVGLAQVAERINGLSGDEWVYLTPTPADHYTLQFLTRRPFDSFDGRAGRVYPPHDRAATTIILLQEDGVTLPGLQETRPDGRVLWTLADAYGQPYAAAYYVPRGSPPGPQPYHGAGNVLGDVWSGRVLLLGYLPDREEVAPGETVNVTLYWQALAPLGKDYTAFVHLLGEHNPVTDGPLWAGHDGQPDGGHYPTTRWQPGEVILDVHPLAIPPDAPPGEYKLEVGLYFLETMERLPVEDWLGEPLPGNAALPGTLEVVSGAP
jgi:4-amino-4-deoxy-L-arabinose transferase-like glycosyltransferase